MQSHVHNPIPSADPEEGIKIQQSMNLFPPPNLPRGNPVFPESTLPIKLVFHKELCFSSQSELSFHHLKLDNFVNSVFLFLFVLWHSLTPPQGIHVSFSSWPDTYKQSYHQNGSYPDFPSSFREANLHDAQNVSNLSYKKSLWLYILRFVSR